MTCLIIDIKSSDLRQNPVQLLKTILRNDSLSFILFPCEGHWTCVSQMATLRLRAVGTQTQSLVRVSGLCRAGRGVRAMTEVTWERLDLVAGVGSRGQVERNVPAGWGEVPPMGRSDTPLGQARQQNLSQWKWTCHKCHQARTMPWRRWPMNITMPGHILPYYFKKIVFILGKILTNLRIFKKQSQ